MNVLRPVTYTIANMVCAAESAPEFTTTATFNTGASAQVAAENSVYKSLIDGNTNGATPSLSADWIKDGATNPSRLSDGFLHSQTIGDETINNGSVSFDVISDSIDAFALMNIEADTIDMTYLADDGVTVIKQQTVNLILNADLDIIDYIYNEEDKLKNSYLVYLQRAYTTTVRIALHKTIGVAKVGICLPGKILQIGQSKWGIETPKKNYGKRVDNDFGISTFVIGKKVKTMKVDCLIPTDEFSIIDRELDDLLDTPTLFLGDARENGQESTWVYGTLKSAIPIMENELGSKILIKIDGLI